MVTGAKRNYLITLMRCGVFHLYNSFSFQYHNNFCDQWIVVVVVVFVFASIVSVSSSIAQLKNHQWENVWNAAECIMITIRSNLIWLLLSRWGGNHQLWIANALNYSFPFQISFLFSFFAFLFIDPLARILSFVWFLISLHLILYDLEYLNWCKQSLK